MKFMPKAKGRRKFNLRRVRIAATVPIAALAALDVVAGNIIPVSTNVYRLVSLKCSFNIADLGATIDDGQEIGIAHGDYSAAEIEECLEAQAAIDIADLVTQELADRKIRSLGYVAGLGELDQSRTLNQGRPVKVKLNWLIGIGDTVKVWVRNGSDTVYTTGSAVTVLGDAWVTP